MAPLKIPFVPDAEQNLMQNTKSRPPMASIQTTSVADYRMNRKGKDRVSSTLTKNGTLSAPS